MIKTNMLEVDTPSESGLPSTNNTWRDSGVLPKNRTLYLGSTDSVNYLRKGNYPDVKPSGIKNAGFGLFATRDYKKGEFVTLYGGVIISEEDHIQNKSDYVLRTRQGTLIDSCVVLYPLIEKGRWVNDARGTEFKNNCIWLEPEPGIIMLFTDEPVKKGEEFFISYGEEYWKHRDDDPLKLTPLEEMSYKGILKERGLPIE